MKKLFVLLLLISLLIASVSCSGNNLQTMVKSVDNIQSEESISADLVSQSTASNSDNSQATSEVEISVEMTETHEVLQDYEWETTDIVSIQFNGATASLEGPGVTLDGSNVVISNAGTYQFSGIYDDGQIIVDTDDKEIVRLILNGMDIRNSSSAPINIINAEKTMIVLADGTENIVTDASTYLFESEDIDEPNAAIFSKSDLTIYGSGSLVVNANYNDGIVSKDGLIIHSGNITINAVNDGIRGKDYVVIKNANLSIATQGDGIKSDNGEDTSKGYITIESGIFNIIAGGDAIAAQTNVLIIDGDFYLTSGGGSENWIGEIDSAKGIKAGVNIEINNGSFQVNSADDAFHSNNSLVINGGSYSILSGDDGIHADSTLEINGGEIKITKSYEGIESAVITINAGDISIVSSDDGLNVAGGNDGSGMMQGGRPGGKPGQNGGPGQDSFNYTSDYYLYINGGTIVIEADGDGVDVNGAFEMSNGVVIVNGPTENMNGALDVDSGFKISGGFIIAAGSAGMAEAPGQSSSQSSILINFSTTQQAGTLFHLQNRIGEDLITFAPSKTYQSIAFSSPDLLLGESYTVFLGGSSAENEVNGLYQTGGYSAGSEYTSFTISDITTMIGNQVR